MVYKITAEGKERFQELLAQAGPETYDDAGFGVHFAFFARTDQATRLRILEGRRRRVEERREGLRDVLARAAERLDAYTLELQRHGLDACRARGPLAGGAHRQRALRPAPGGRRPDVPPRETPDAAVGPRTRAACNEEGGSRDGLRPRRHRRCR